MHSELCKDKCYFQSEIKWINVNDRLPPNEKYVIIATWHQHKNFPMYHVQTAQRMGDDWLDGHDGDMSKQKNSTITHWMPIPDPPSPKNSQYDNLF